MPDLDQRMTLAVILKNFPYAGHVLQRHGLDDLLCWLGTPLQEACRELKLDVARVLQDIAADGLAPPKPRSTLVVDPGSEDEALAAAEAEREEIEAELTAEEPEEEPAPPPSPDAAIPDVAAMFRARPKPEPVQKPRPTQRPTHKPTGKPTGKPALDPAQQAKLEAEARARAEEDRKASESLPDVAAMFRARPAAPPPPPTEEEQAAQEPQKGLVVPPKDSGSVLSKVMSWDRPE